MARDFDRLLERFRRDFEDILWPSERSIEQMLSKMPAVEIRVPQIDLEDRGKDFLLKAESETPLYYFCSSQRCCGSATTPCERRKDD
jgi:hypothetical protein